MQTLNENRELKHKMTLFNSLFCFWTYCGIAVASLWPHLLPCQRPSWVESRWYQPQTRAGSLCTLIQIFWWISYYNPFKDIIEKPARLKLAPHEFESPAWIELGALTEGGKTLGVRPSYSGDPEVCLTCSTQSVWQSNSHSLKSHWLTHLPGRLTCLTPQQTIFLY